MSQRVRYTVNDVSNNRFYQMPKFLFEGEFKALSNNARVLYSLLRDRHDLSLQNQWINKNNEVYLIYTRKNMEEMLGLADKTVKKAVEQLKEFGLIEEEHMGLNKANRIYLTSVHIENTGIVKTTTPEQEDLRFQNRNIYDSRTGDFTIQEPYILRSNDTDFNNTNFIDTDFSQSVKEVIKKENQPIGNATDRQTDFDNTKLFFEEKISLNELHYAYPSYKEILDEIAFNILEMYFNDYTTIKGERKPQAIIRSALMKLDYNHIAELLSKFKNLRTRVTNPKAYMQTTIYNIVFENGFTINNTLKSEGII